ncbi:MAG TPA: GTP-binding protein [Candidatus Choladousia intestinigallinarum]|nr:GTP-binding protein [Candidatus Choladousia intestinigallinarum]
MVKVDIVSGFLGAGKTTLIKKLIKEVFAGQQIVLIENEFGEIGIDGGFLKDAGINITEMNSGCICCSLVGDFGKALKEVTKKFSPDRIIIEPSGVGKLSDVRRAVEDAAPEAGLELNGLVTVADVSKVKMYMRNFGEFYDNQIQYAGTVILSRTQKVSEEKQMKAVELIREKNPEGVIITTPWEELTGQQILNAIERSGSLAEKLMEEEEVCPVCGHHHEHHDHDHEDHGHEHHGHDHEEHGHEHHHHDHEECGCHEHEHHDHDHEGHGHEHHHHDHEECGCHEHHGHDHHHGHHHHHADEVFTSWGRETPRKYTREELEGILHQLENSEDYGVILRAKGMLPDKEGKWLHFDFVPEEYEIREGSADYTGRLCVIGSKLKEEALEKLFYLA